MRTRTWIPVCPRCGATDYQPLGNCIRLCLPCGRTWEQVGPPEDCARVAAGDPAAQPTEATST